MYKQSQKLVHRLIAEAFIPNPQNYPVVNHIDGNKQNNSISNLEWCTQEHNMEEAKRLNLFKPGKNLPGKRKVNQYEKNGNFIREWESLISVQRALNYKTGAISLCCRGKLKTAYGYIWEYVKEEWLYWERLNLDGKDKENGKWRIGDLIRMEYFVAGEDGKIYIGDFERSIPYEVLPETTGQFTGLYDKNKVPIYERRYSFY